LPKVKINIIQTGNSIEQGLLYILKKDNDELALY